MSLQPAKVNFTIWKGATFSKRITLYTDTTSTTAKDITGYEAIMEIKDKRNGTVLYTLSTGNSRITIGGSSGTLDLKITDDDTSAFSWVGAVYDLLITDGNSDSDAILYGSVRIQSV